MRAAVRYEYGPPEVLRTREIQPPTPGDDEILLRVHAASVNLGDWEILTGRPRYIRVLAEIFGPKPLFEPQPIEPDGSARPRRRGPKYKILGTDVAGRVEAVGRNVTELQPGDEVFGEAGFGAFAEQTLLKSSACLVRKPAGMSWEQAAAIPQASFIALQGLRDMAELQAGQTVLVNGAGGGAGTFAVQLAKRQGAEVTGVDLGHKLPRLRELGADHVIDYQAEDFTKNGKRYDVILDLAAYRSIFDSRRSLAEGGIYLMAGGSWQATWQSMALGPLLSRNGKPRVAFLLADSRKDDLLHMIELFEAGTVRPVLDRSYALADASEALRRIGEQASFGKVVIRA